MTCYNLEILQAGLVRYSDGLDIQARAAERVRAGELDGIIITINHPPVITMGRRAETSELHATPERLAEMGIDLHKVDRGGGATYHYPEQSVLYPILNLTALKLTVPELLKISGLAVMDILTAHGVDGVWDESKPGVYLRNGAKVASIGYHLSKGFTTHGIAINTGRGYNVGFSLIDPCKVVNQPIAAVQDVTGIAPDPAGFGNSVAEAMIRMIGNPHETAARTLVTTADS